MISRIFLAIFLLSIISSCNSQEDQPTPQTRSLTATEQEIVTASNDFAMDILSRVNTDHASGNVFISPFSISTALSMTLNGAAGETKEAIKETLGLEGLSDQAINENYQALVSYIYGLDPSVTLNVANSTWYRQELTVKEAFEQALLTYFEAEVKGADFSDPGTVDLINGWIENETNDKIKNMLSEIPEETVMYLINAIYFKANWTAQFDKSETEDRPFQLADGSTVSVPTMYLEESKHWVSNDFEKGLRLVDIPYGNENYGFTIVMPNDPADINELVESFTMGDLEALLQDTTSVDWELFLPKLKIEFKQLLNNYLIDMGMGIAFTDQADLSNLFEEDLSLLISMVLHQSFLEVNEEGTEAAAATIVGVELTSAPPQSRIDQPFLFFIRERNSNTILFSGKVMNPAE